MLENKVKQEGRGETDSCIIKSIIRGSLQVNTLEKKELGCALAEGRPEEILPLRKYDNVMSVSPSARMQSVLSDMHTNTHRERRTHTHTFGSVLAREVFAAG